MLSTQIRDIIILRMKPRILSWLHLFNWLSFCLLPSVLLPFLNQSDYLFFFFNLSCFLMPIQFVWRVQPLPYSKVHSKIFRVVKNYLFNNNPVSLISMNICFFCLDMITRRQIQDLKKALLVAFV